MSILEKDSAYSFLRLLEAQLNQTASPHHELSEYVNSIWKKPREAKLAREKLESKENIAFYSHAAPQIFELATSYSNRSSAEVKEAFRCVYHQKFPELSNSNVFRKSGHPFSK